MSCKHESRVKIDGMKCGDCGRIYVNGVEYSPHVPILAYWHYECGDNTHRHSSEEEAEACHNEMVAAGTLPVDQEPLAKPIFRRIEVSLVNLSKSCGEVRIREYSSDYQKEIKPREWVLCANID